MELRCRQLASFLLISFSTLLINNPLEAQELAYRHPTYARVYSASLDKTGNFLLLNFGKPVSIPAPAIQYLPGPDGKTVLVADFAGMTFKQDPLFLKPSGDDIESVRVGQFQESPPILRVSITSSNPACFKKLDFRCQEQSLSICFSPVLAKQAALKQAALKQAALKQAAAKQAAAKQAAAKQAALQQAAAKQAAAKQAALKQAAASGSDTGKIEKPSQAQVPPPAISNTGSEIPGTGLKNKELINKSYKEKSSIYNPPFKSGGLFLNLPAPDDLAKSSSEEGEPAPAAEFKLRPEIKQAPELKQSSEPTKTAEIRQAPEIVQRPELKQAPEFKKSRTLAQMPEKAPQIRKTVTEQNRNNSKSEAEQMNQENKASKKGFACKLKRLFCPAKEETPETEPEKTVEYSNIENQASVVQSTGPNSGDAESRKETGLTSPNPAIAYSGKDPFKIQFKFESKPNYKCFELEDPARYVIDIEDADLRVEAIPDFSSNQFLKGMRFGNPEANIARIVLDLADSNVQIKEANQESAIELVLSKHPRAHGQTVIIDAGHGGSDPGAQRGDIQEKEITLAISKKLKSYLEERGFRVLMTRSDDSFVSLEDRVKLTNQVKPQAFVSVHINSLETDRDIKGIETYYQTEQSRGLADKIHSKLVDNLSVPDRSVRKARFYVVNHTEHPAILAEVGFISNKDERNKLISSDYQAKIAESLGQGVMLFLGIPEDAGLASISKESLREKTKQNSGEKEGESRLAKQGLSALKQKETGPASSKPEQKKQLAHLQKPRAKESKQGK